MKFIQGLLRNYNFTFPRLSLQGPKLFLSPLLLPVHPPLSKHHVLERVNMIRYPLFSVFQWSLILHKTEFTPWVTQPQIRGCWPFWIQTFCCFPVVVFVVVVVVVVVLCVDSLVVLCLCKFLGRPVDWYLNFDLWKVATSSSEIEEEKRCTCLFTKWESNRMVTAGTLAGQPQPSYYQLTWDPSHVRHCLCATTKTRANVPAQRGLLRILFVSLQPFLFFSDCTVLMWVVAACFVSLATSTLCVPLNPQGTVISWCSLRALERMAMVPHTAHWFLNLLALQQVWEKSCKIYYCEWLQRIKRDNYVL